MKTIILLAWIMIIVQSSVAADRTSPYTKFYIVTDDTIASLEIPTGYHHIEPPGTSSPIGKIIYSDSCYLLYSVGQPAGVHLLSEPDFVQTGTDTINDVMGWRSGGRGMIMERIETYGHVRENPRQQWHEDSVGVNGGQSLRTAFVTSARWQQNHFFRVLRSLERYASVRACVKFLAETRYLPEKGHASGTYTYSTGFAYDDLELKNDGSFTLQGGDDIHIEGCPDPGFKGHYTVNGDTLRMQTEAYIIPKSSSDEWKKELRESEANMVKHVNESFDFYLFKKIGDFVFIVHVNRLFEFACDAIVHGGLPEFSVGNGDYAAHYLTKLKK